MNNLSSTLGKQEFIPPVPCSFIPMVVPDLKWVWTNDLPKEPEAAVAGEPARRVVMTLTVSASCTDTAAFTIGRSTEYIRDLSDPRVTLLQPLAVTVEYFDDKASAYCSEIDEFAVADEGRDPIAEIKAVIVDLYFLLSAEQENFGSVPQAKWNTLRTIVREY